MLNLPVVSVSGLRLGPHSRTGLRAPLTTALFFRTMSITAQVLLLVGQIIVALELSTDHSPLKWVLIPNSPFNINIFVLAFQYTDLQSYLFVVNTQTDIEAKSTNDRGFACLNLCKR